MIIRGNTQSERHSAKAKITHDWIQRYEKLVEMSLKDLGTRLEQFIL